MVLSVLTDIEAKARILHKSVALSNSVSGLFRLKNYIQGTLSNFILTNVINFVMVHC